MLDKCVNAACSAQFRYLREGRLFEVETRYFDHLAGEGGGTPGNGKVHVERFWLCDQCVGCVGLRFDRRRGLVLETLTDSERVVTEVIAQPDSRAASEMAWLLIRPLDLDPVGTRRRTISELSVRRRGAA